MWTIFLVGEKNDNNEQYNKNGGSIIKKLKNCRTAVCR